MKQSAKSRIVSPDTPDGALSKITPSANEGLDKLIKSTLEKGSGEITSESPNGHRPSAGDISVNLKGRFYLQWKLGCYLSQFFFLCMLFFFSLT